MLANQHLWRVHIQTESLVVLVKKTATKQGKYIFCGNYLNSCEMSDCEVFPRKKCREYTFFHFFLLPTFAFYAKKEPSLPHSHSHIRARIPGYSFCRQVSTRNEKGERGKGREKKVSPKGTNNNSSRKHMTTKEEAGKHEKHKLEELFGGFQSLVPILKIPKWKYKNNSLRSLHSLSFPGTKKGKDTKQRPFFFLSSSSLLPSQSDLSSASLAYRPPFFF